MSTKLFKRSIFRQAFGCNLIAILLLGLFITGCASHYQITTIRGEKITTRSKPHYDKATATWYYTDASGVKKKISGGSVSEVAPTSLVEADKEDKFVKPVKK